MLGDPKTQIGGFINAIAAAALSKAFPQGIERAALGKALQSMTVRDFVTGGGLDAMRKGAFGQEIRAMGKTLFADAADQALQGFLNHLISEVSKATAHGKDIRLGDLLGDALYSSGIATATGMTSTQARKGRGPSFGGETNPTEESPPSNNKTPSAAYQPHARFQMPAADKGQFTDDIGNSPFALSEAKAKAMGLPPGTTIPWIEGTPDFDAHALPKWIAEDISRSGKKDRIPQT